MARKVPSQIEAIEKASVYPEDEPNRFRLGDIGVSGLSIFGGITETELKRELNFPNSIKTYQSMSYHTAVYAPLSLYKSLVNKVTYRFKLPDNPTAEEKNKAEILEQMLFKDMEHPFSSFIDDAMTMTLYGFAPVEKVYRRRTKASGSLFDDGLIAPKKLALRHQTSIEKFIFDETGDNVLAVKQCITGTNDPYGRYSSKGSSVSIPRSKFMLFTTGNNRANPYGTSPLRNVYLPYRYLSALEEIEAGGVQKEITGIPLLRIPAQYMAADAPAEQKALYEQFKNIVRNLQAGNQSGVVLPSAYDEQTRQALFDLELLSSDGKRQFDISAIKEYYRSLIFIGMQADILLLGNTATGGSFALGTVKNSLTGNAVEGFLRSIVQIVNKELILQIYQLNSWNTDRMIEIDYEGFEGESLDDVGKFVQRCAAVGMMTKDVDTINYIRKIMGIDPLPEGTTQEDLDEMLTDKTSRSSDGMQEGLNSGTGTSDGSSGNASDINNNNAS